MRWDLDSPLKVTKRMSSERDREGDVLCVVVEDLIVDLVGKNDEVMSLRRLYDPDKDVPGVDRAGRVIRIYHDDAPGPRTDFGLHILQVGHPVRLLVAHVVDSLSSREVTAAVHRG